MSTPYRIPARAEIVIRAGPFTANYVWTIWFATAVWLALLVFLEGAWTLRIVSAGIAAVMVLALMLWSRTRRKFHVVLEGPRVRVERVENTERELLGSIDVSMGVEVATQVMDGAHALDSRVIVAGSGERFELHAGSAPARVASRLARFLRAHGVEVRERHD